MKIQPLVPGLRRDLKGMLVSLALALLLVAGLFLAGVLLPPLTTPMYALNAPAAANSQASSSTGVNGTLASFTALYPELISVYIPFIVR